jgi:hypothetical protein
MNPAEKKLLAVFRQLADEERETFLAFGEFLAGRDTNRPVEPIPEPQHTPRPEKESVVAAIKRLSATYPMLDKPQLLNETSVLMTQHVMQGRGANEVIDEIEVLFLRFYEELVSEQNEKNQ